MINGFDKLKTYLDRGALKFNITDSMGNVVELIETKEIYIY